ncbi:MAG: LysR substrate-binding domain-containing protein [Pseudomonadota bacterium]
MPRRKLPPLNWLRSFEASARHQSFTLAAEELHLTQAAISKQVKNLEYSLGVTLFNRLPRGLELSESGAAYLPAVHETIERLAAATDELFGYGHARVLKVRCSLVFLSTWLAPRLKRFRDAYPNIDLRIGSSIWANENDDKDVELDIKYGRGDWPQSSSYRLTKDSLIPVCSPAIQESDSPILELNDLTNHTLLHVAGYEEGWSFWMSQHGSLKMKSAANVHFDSLIGAFEVAKSGFGVALGRTSLVEHSLSTGDLVAPLDLSTPIEEAFYLLSSASIQKDSNAAKFREWILDEANTHIAK